MDSGCREHDVAYSQNKELDKRHIFDIQLSERAWERVKAVDSSVGEKTEAWFVTNAMKAKKSFGMGVKPKSNSSKKNPKKKNGGKRSGGSPFCKKKEIYSDC